MAGNEVFLWVYVAGCAGLFFLGQFLIERRRKMIKAKREAEEAE